MIKHIILWKLKSHYSKEEILTIKNRMKSMLENLNGKIDGLLSLQIHINPTDNSNCDVMLESSFTNNDALKKYIVHPLHQEAAQVAVRPFVETRNVFDFEIIE